MRLGDNAYPHEYLVGTYPEEKARQVIKSLRNAQARKRDAGYPWPGEDVHGFHYTIYDTFYLAVVEEGQDFHGERLYKEK